MFLEKAAVYQEALKDISAPTNTTIPQGKSSFPPPARQKQAVMNQIHKYHICSLIFVKAQCNCGTFETGKIGFLN